jgi:hypothetical protein
MWLWLAIACGSVDGGVWQGTCEMPDGAAVADVTASFVGADSGHRVGPGSAVLWDGQFRAASGFAEAGAEGAFGSSSVAFALDVGAFSVLAKGTVDGPSYDGQCTIVLAEPDDPAFDSFGDYLDPGAWLLAVGDSAPDVALGPWAAVDAAEEADALVGTWVMTR